MSKIAAITKKNFKLVLRSKTSALIMLIGPILVMFIIGIIFNSSATDRINVGYFSSQETNLTSHFIDSMRDNYEVTGFSDLDECKTAIGAGKVHLCIVFPDNFVIENNKVNEVEFLVDNSKVSFFQNVLDSIENEFNNKALELTSGFTQEILDKLNQTSSEIGNKTEIIANLKLENSEIYNDLKITEGKLKDMNVGFDEDDLEIDDLEDFGRDLSRLRNYANNAVDETEDLIGEVEDFFEDLNINGTAQEELDDLLNQTQENINEIKTKLNDTGTSDEYSDLMDDLKKNVNDLEENLELASSSKSVSLNKVRDMKTKTQSSLSKIAAVEETFNAIVSNIDNTEITNLNSIIKPIEKKITPVVAEDSQLNFYFPYLTILIIMFVGILLSSTLVNMEKMSKAYFRNFVTPTKDSAFLISTYLTSMIVICMQICFLMLIITFYFKKDIYSNLPLTMLILFSAASIFTLLGMVIGNVFNSHESNTIASIMLSSIMLFVSDLIFPIERMPEYIANIVKLYNPFLLCSELLRKSIIHKIPIYMIQKELVIIFISCLVLLTAVWITHKLMKKHLFLRFAGYIARRDLDKKLKDEDYKKIYTKIKYLPSTEYFITLQGKNVKNMKELINFIDSIDNKTFKEYANREKNLFGDWFDNVIKFENLATKLYKTQSKRKTLKILKKAQKEFDKFEKKLSDAEKKN